jgi:hypothetical protein
MSKITVKFETTRGRLEALMDDADACPGEIIEGETLRDVHKLRINCTEFEHCEDCHKAFIDRITVSFAGTGTERTGEDGG